MGHRQTVYLHMRSPARDVAAHQGLHCFKTVSWIKVYLAKQL